MDSLTHIAVGAVLGEAIAGKRLGKWAMVWGALFQSIPDIDVVAGAWMDLPHELLAHRGFTHSLLFMLLLSLAGAAMATRWRPLPHMAFRHWFWLLMAELGCHLFLDGFNNYGTGWLEPFSHRRFSINALYVIDPFFSLLPIGGMLLLFWLKTPALVRRKVTLITLLLPAAYLGYAVFNKSKIETAFRKQIAAEFPQTVQHFSTPAPFNTWLWFLVLEQGDGFYCGYRSVFDSSAAAEMHFVPAHRQLALPGEEMAALQRFSQGFYTLEQRGDSLVLNDLRFGQMTGWYNPQAPFVFHYYLTHSGSNDLVVQRGRFTGWNNTVRASFWRRIRGKK